MKICDTKDHGEIVFDGRDCEACETIEDLKEQIKELVGKVNDLGSELDEEAQRNAEIDNGSGRRSQQAG